jgi:hypothetical protein
MLASLVSLVHLLINLNVHVLLFLHLLVTFSNLEVNPVLELMLCNGVTNVSDEVTRKFPKKSNKLDFEVNLAGSTKLTVFPSQQPGSTRESVHCSTGWQTEAWF